MHDSVCLKQRSFLIGGHTIGLGLAHFGTVSCLNTYLVVLVGFRGKI